MNAEDVQAAAIAEDAPIFMLNLLRYKAQADYGGASEMAPCSGREAYHERYVPAFGQLTQGEGIQLFWLGSVMARVVGPPDETWDEIALVRYPSFSTFRRLIESEEYKAQADPHRRAALEDWRLIATTQMPTG